MNAAPERLTDRASAVLRAEPSVRRSSLIYARVAIVLLSAVAISACTTTAHQVSDPHLMPQSTAKAPTAIDEARELRVAQTALQGGDLDMATNIYGRLLQQKPQSVPGLTGLGDTLYAVGDYTRANVYYRKAVSLEPKAEPALIGIARVAIQQRRLDDAATAYRKVLALQPNQPLAAAGLGAALDMLGDHAGAQASMRAALDANPGDIGLSINLGLSLVMDGKVREGADMLLDVTRFPGAPAQARYDLALAYGLMGNDEDAARLLSDLPKQAVDDNLRYYATLRERRAASPAAQVSVAPQAVPHTLPATAARVAGPISRAEPPAVSTAVTAMAVPSPVRSAPRVPVALANVPADSTMASGGVISGRLTGRSTASIDGVADNLPARLASQSAPVLP